MCGLLCFFPYFSPRCSYAGETIVAGVVLNHEDKGDFFVVVTDELDFLVKEEDLKAMGILSPEGTVVEFQGERYLSLGSIRGVEFNFNDKDVVLEITADPALFKKQTIDLRTIREMTVFRPRHSSMFFNYGLNYTGGDSLSLKRFTLTNQLGVRYRDLLLFTDTIYTKERSERNFARLMSNITYDNRADLTRLVAGDLVATSGELGSRLNLGGVSYTKLYRINPYFIKQPTLDIQGFVTLPSDYEVYIDGTRIRTGTISPGEFELGNIYQVVGSRVVDVVLRDPFGRETRLVYPFYFTDKALGKGLHEYAYAIGFLREGFGTESNEYGDLTFIGYHDYGVTNSLTVGTGAEVTGNFWNLSPAMVYILPRYGVASLTVLASRDTGRYGRGVSVTHDFVGRTMATHAFLNRYSKGYTTVAARKATVRTRYELGAGINYGSRDTGYIALNMSYSNKYNAKDRRETSLNYTVALGRNLVLTTRMKRVKEDERSNELLVVLNYYPGRDSYVSAGHKLTKDRSSQTFQAQKNPPLGEGYGGRVYMERDESRTETTYTFNPYVQYNAKYGILRAEHTRRSTDRLTEDTYRFSAFGAVVYAGDTLGLTRPVYDSFGLVNVDDLEGVRVYANNQLVGRTNPRGLVFIPALNSYYNNEIRIENKDIPVEYYTPVTARYVSPPYRSGSCVDFVVQRIQGFMGLLKVRLDGTVKPVEYSKVAMDYDGRRITFYTGRDGEFFIENYGTAGRPLFDAEDEAVCRFDRGDDRGVFEPGTYTASFEYMGRMFSAVLEIPETDEMFVDLGEVVFEVTR